MSDATLIRIMPTRAADFETAVRGYADTGIPLVAFDGTRFVPAGAGSDPGTFYFVPKLASWLNVPALAAADILLTGSLLIGLAVSVAAVWVLCRGRAARMNGIAAVLLVCGIAFMSGDQYVIAPAVTLPLVLWFLVLWQRPATPRNLAIFLACAGVFIGLANVSRAHAATAVAIFIAVVLLADLRRSVLVRATLGLSLIAGMAVAPLWFQSLTSQRDRFLADSYAGYHPPHPAHPFWHSVYIGFGYLSNPHVPEYRDEVAAARVEAIAPGTPYVSREYDRILRDEVVQLVRNEPRFVAHTLFVKLGAVLLHLVFFAHLGLVAALRGVNDVRFEAAIWAALAFSALPGLLVMPWPGYLSGFTAFAAIYGLVSLDAWLRTANTGNARHASSPTGAPHEPVPT